MKEMILSIVIMLSLMVSVLWFGVRYQSEKTQKLINKNHKVVLSQIEKQINTQTEFIKALRECLEDE